MSQTSKTLDEQFIVYMLEIDARYKVFPKSDRAKIEQWVSHTVTTHGIWLVKTIV